MERNYSIEWVIGQEPIRRQACARSVYHRDHVHTPTGICDILNRRISAIYSRSVIRQPRSTHGPILLSHGSSIYCLADYDAKFQIAGPE